MIARMWRGQVSREKKEAYVEYLKKTGLKDYATTPGNRGVYLLASDKDGVVEFATLTFWDSLDAVKAFAGKDYTHARYYPEDKEFLLSFAPEVEHFEVIESR